MEFIEKQVERGQTAGSSNEPVYTEFQRTNDDEKITVKLQNKTLRMFCHFIIVYFYFS